MEMISFTPKQKNVRFDIMVGKQWRGQIAFTMLPGVKYMVEELKAKTLEKRPSLKRYDFVLVPTDQKV